MAESRQIHFRISMEDFERLDAKAKAYNIKISTLFLDAANAYVRQREPGEDPPNLVAVDFYTWNRIASEWGHWSLALDEEGRNIRVLARYAEDLDSEEINARLKSLEESRKECGEALERIADQLLAIDRETLIGIAHIGDGKSGDDEEEGR